RHRLFHTRMPVLRWDAHLEREITSADLQDVDSTHRGDGVRVLDRLFRLQHYDAKRLSVQHVSGFGEWDTLPLEMRKCVRDRAVALRVEPAAFGDCSGLLRRVHMRCDDTQKSVGEHEIDL